MNLEAAMNGIKRQGETGSKQKTESNELADEIRYALLSNNYLSNSYRFLDKTSKALKAIRNS
jgi:hypothetical protein